MKAMLHPAPVPPGYPAEYEETVLLRDGTSIFVRPLVPADRTALASALQDADDETLYFRFFRTSIRVNDELVDYLTKLDYRSRFALAAFEHDGEGIGIARYEGTPASDTAEAAVVVRPDWRSRGIGTALLTRLADAAGARGIRYLQADFLSANGPARALIAKAGLDPPVYEGGVGSVRHELRVPPGS